jgi:dipeptidyl aminopeptidase/acylaminoacyl peptidase
MGTRPTIARRRARRLFPATTVSFTSGRAFGLVACLVLLSGGACSPIVPTPRPSAVASAVDSPSSTPASARPTRIQHVGYAPIETGDPIDVAALSGRVVFDDFENVYAMDVDGSSLVTVAGAQGPEFDGSWSPDGRSIVYRDSTRGVNNDDEIVIAAADGSTKRNLTNNPADDWGPDWSHDGSTIAFNSTRDGPTMGGYLVNPDASDLRRIEADVWIEYPAFSPDDSRIAFMSVDGSSYSIKVIELATGDITQLTHGPGEDGWPAWSPDGTTIAFTSQRDDCGFAALDQECWRTGDIGPHHDIWLVNADGSNLRRVTAEFGQFVTWSPDGQYLLISGAGLYVVRPDGTGRLELHAGGSSGAGIPDWR